ncbi:MAG: formate dehydrogenase accessory protein FdhE [Desulfarculaceae bacterium]|nr:formate dehydrogenase accessory protein FdhE [Desulfarculaceae bacterium]
MPDKPDDAAPARELQNYLDGLARETPGLAPVVAAFGPLLIAQAMVKAALPPLNAPEAKPKDDEPLATPWELLALGPELGAYLRQAAEAILPAIQEGFPALGGEAEAIGEALKHGALDGAACCQVLFEGDAEGLERLAQEAGLDPAALGFALLALAKPRLEQAAEALAPALEGREWPHGYCPICGEPPELAFLQGESGQRWLRCSLCGHHWRFARLACPACGCEDSDQLDYFYAEGAEQERVDACRACGKYLVTLDLRERDQPPAWAGAGLGLIHLDLLAQEQGLIPNAWCAWNRLS